MSQSDITASDLMKAYEQYTGGVDQPDYIILMDGKCPSCRADWVVPYTFCQVCDFPRNL